MAGRTPKLLVTIDENKRTQCEREILRVLDEAGIPQARLLKGAPPGVVEVDFDADPKVALERLREICREDPFAFAHTHRWVPVESWTEPDRKHLADFMRRFEAQIAPDESWRLEVHKTSSPMSSREVLATAAEYVGRPRVDLEHPDKTIHIELVGHKAGVSLLRPEDQFNVNELRRNEFVEFREDEKNRSPTARRP